MVESSHQRNRSPKITQRKEKQATPIKDRIGYRRHKGACRFYRENWSCETESDGAGGQLLYQIICLMDTPPVTAEEQHMCLHSPTRCWRLERAGRNGKNGHCAGQRVQEGASEDSEDTEAAQDGARI